MPIQRSNPEPMLYRTRERKPPRWPFVTLGVTCHAASGCPQPEDPAIVPDNPTEPMIFTTGQGGEDGVDTTAGDVLGTELTLMMSWS